MYTKIDRAALDALLGAKKKVVKEVDLTDIDVQSPPVDFSGAVIESCTLSNMNFTGLAFRKATVKHCWVNGTDFSRADFSDGKLVGSFLCKLQGAKFHRATLKKTDFMSAELEGAAFDDADLEKASFQSAKLDGATFPRAQLSGVELLDASVKGADFTGAILDGIKTKKVDVGSAIGLVVTKGVVKPGTSTTYDTAGAEGGPIIVVPAGLAAAWKPAALDAGIDDVVTAAEWVETGSVAFEGGRVLALPGELDTGFIAVEDGGVLIRGGDFDDDLKTATKAVAKALKKKGWKAHAHDLVLADPDIFVFSSSSTGAANASDIESDFGVIHAPLAKGTYAVLVLGSEQDGEPVVYIHLKRR
jgi:uncharacterized protein YjbI with pentapeptide repeats